MLQCGQSINKGVVIMMNEHENLTNQRLNRETTLKRPITLYDLKALYEYLNKELQFFNDCKLCIPLEVKTDSECWQYQDILQSLIDIISDAKIQCEYLFSAACTRERMLITYDK